MLAERGLDVSYETVRRWFMKFGTVVAANLRSKRPHPRQILRQSTYKDCREESFRTWQSASLAA